MSDKYKWYNVAPVRVPNGRKRPSDTLREIEKRARAYAKHNGPDYQTVLARFKAASLKTFPEED